MKSNRIPIAANQSYTPPNSAEIARGQNEEDPLRLLLAQRLLYSKAKRWMALRLWGMGFIAIAAPVVALIWPSLSVAVGAIAGAWIFVGRTVFIVLERHLTAQAAGVQELFDIKVFQMPHLAARSPMPALEDISHLVGPDSEIRARAEKEKLPDWYPVNLENSGLTTIAICQRANASYSRSLLIITSRIWLGIISTWTAILIAISIAIGLTLKDFLLAVLLPLLPAFLDTFDLWRAFNKASIERENLAKEIEENLRGNNVTPEETVIWQTRMYDIRRDMPQVPEWIYWFARKRNEEAMGSAARQLSDKSREVK